MEEDKIVVVGGYIGCGKTAWIHQQIALKEKAFPQYYKKILYLKAGTEQVHIDQKRISIDFPKVKVFYDIQKADFIKELNRADMAYIELDNNLGLGYIDQLLNDLPYYPVAILPPGCKRCKWHSWAKEVLIGSAMKIAIGQMEMLRIPTVGKVISGDNFNNLWNALINGTYGKVMRVKGIFHLEDGNIIYADFIYGVECIDFLNLNLSRYLHGELKCFSAIEIVGYSLNKIALQEITKKMYVTTYKIL
ncbi:MAG: GTP-binding protein [Cyanobacteriota bacterium]|nr:GTP-binding protein [Cyanobacteriota bacterium]